MSNKRILKNNEKLMKSTQMLFSMANIVKSETTWSLRLCYIM